LNAKRDKLVPDDHHKIDGETVSGKIIEIGTGEGMDFVYGGAVLDNCELHILGSARDVNIFDVTLRNSVIKTRRELRNLQLLDVKFENCTFLGKYRGCRFGQLDPENIGTISNCDFSGAQLDSCDFYEGSDIDSLTFPSWPHIVVRQPYAWREECLQIPFPTEFHISQEVVVDLDMMPCEAIVIYLPRDCPNYDSMRSLVSVQEHIIIND